MHIKLNLKYDPLEAQDLNVKKKSHGMLIVTRSVNYSTYLNFYLLQKSYARYKRA